MLFSIVIAALSALPAISAQDVSSSATRCTTRFGYYPLPTGTAAVPTWFKFTTTTNVFQVTYTTRDSVTVTPSATTFTDVITTTAVFSVTTTSVPAPTTVPTPAGFLPLVAFNPAGPTAAGLSRFKRYDLQGRDAETALELVRRQTAANSTGGYQVDRNGQSADIYRKYPQQVNCRVSVTVNSTRITIVTGLPETFIVPATAVGVTSTSTVSVTTTIEVVAPRVTKYAACLENNVVNSITGTTGNPLVFDRVIYRPAEGFKVENELLVNTTNPENCCIACQNTAFCAGSFYVPSKSECHLRLTQAPAPTIAGPTLPAPYTLYNDTLPAYQTASGVAPTGTSALVPFPSSTAAPNTCAAGSRSLYLGTIQGQEDFPYEYALSFSNGPCGRLSVWPIPIREDLDTSLEDPQRI
ncbi:hypothetical protein BKA63DRAFT_315636 [Paraphoma chrysanthemicola]|nr:hypothetical protein BKA63DRAFT_315636 [Paraphoma chrysanthemicola]